MNATDAPELTAVPNDDELAHRAAREVSAFTVLYERHFDTIHRFVRSQVPDDATAEDLTAQVFLKALVSASTYRGDGSYRAWLLSIARNTVTTWRKDKRRGEVPVGDFPDSPDPSVSPAALTLAREDLDLVSRTLDELPQAQQEVVRLRYWKELTIEEIARLTRRSSGAVRQLLHRARQRLRTRLSGKDLTALLGATGASALVAFSIHRHRKSHR